jgi:hypothetical protein
MPADGALHALGPGDVVGGREDVHLGSSRSDLAGERVQGHDRSISSPKNSMRTASLLVHRDDLDGVAAHPERAAGEGQVVARVLHLDEHPQHAVAVDLLPTRSRTIRSTYSCGVPRP